MSLQFTCTSGNRALVNCQNRASLKYSPDSKVLQLITIYFLCRAVPASIQNTKYFFCNVCMWANSTEWHNPNYLTATSGWLREVVADEWIPGKQSAHLWPSLFGGLDSGLDCGTGLRDWTHRKLRSFNFDTAHTLLHYSILTSHELNSGQTAITRCQYR